MVGTSEAWCARSARRRLRRVASAGARWVALRFVRGESVARFGALDRNFPAGGARRPPGAKFFWGRRIVRPRRLQVIAGSSRIDAQRFGHTRREPVRMPETIVPHGFSWVGEISARALRAHRQEASSHVASAETPHGDGGGGFRRPQFVKRS